MSFDSMISHFEDPSSNYTTFIFPFGRIDMIYMTPKKTTQTTNQSISPKKPTSTTIFVDLPKEIIYQKAQSIAQKGLSWNDLNWIIGENEVKLTNALEEKINFLSDSLPSHIPVNINKIIKSPNFEDIRKTAEQIASQHFSLPQLQWNLALQDYILEDINIQ